MHQRTRDRTRRQAVAPLRRARRASLAAIAAAVLGLLGAGPGADSADAQPPFAGRIGETWRDSTPDFPLGARPPDHAPNVVLIVLDDGGFAHLGAYGGPTPTPNLDRLATRGLLYTQFHVNPVCSPTRAALLTGRNAHSVGMGSVSELATGYPGYNAHIPTRAATVAKVLGRAGWTTLAVGKWHLTPFNAFTQAGPFDRWPLGLGFDRFYGFLGGRNDHFTPLLWQDNHRVEAPQKPDYNLGEDLTDHAITGIRDHRQAAADRPFFLYLAYGAVHSPHQAPQPWRDRQRGRFDEGWDVWRERVFRKQLELGLLPAGTELPTRHPLVPAWSALGPDERRLALRFQEAFAAMLEHTDAEIGRVLDELDRLGIRDDTLVIVLSDNGASRAGGLHGLTMVDRYRNGVRQSVLEMLDEIDLIGGPGSDPDYPMGWAMVANTPFSGFKGGTDAGGTRVPLILSWPGQLPAGAVRTQFHHVVDLAPTLYEVLGIDPPHEVDGVEQMPLEGVSMAYTFAAPEAPTRKHSQYWEYSGHRALWREGWLAVDLHQRGEPWSDQGWELYDTRSDFSLAKDLADERRVLGEELVTAWWAEARAHQVLPLDDRGFEKRLDTESRLSDGQPDRLVLLPGTSPIPVAAAPILSNRAHLVTARVSIPDRGAEGVLICQGSRFGGWSLYLRDRRLVYAHNFLGLEERRLVSDREVPAGDLVLQLQWTPSGAGLGTAELIIDHQPAGRSAGIRVARIGYMGDEGLQVGRNGGSSVTPDYASPYPFTGTIVDVVLEISEK